MTRLLLAGLLALTGLGAFADTHFEEGTHYFLVPAPLPTMAADKPEVVELFWYGCPHCYHLEPTLTDWLKSKPADVNFRRIPAVFSADWAPHARAFYAAEALGESARLHAPLFKALHADGQKIYSEDALIRFAVAQGFNEKDFTAAYTGFAIDGKVRQAEQYTRGAGITGVPAIIVNGKYRISVQSAGSEKALIEVVNYLVAKDRAG